MEPSEGAKLRFKMSLVSGSISAPIWGPNGLPIELNLGPFGDRFWPPPSDRAIFDFGPFHYII